MERNRTVYAKVPEARATSELIIKVFHDVMKTNKLGKCYVSDTFIMRGTSHWPFVFIPTVITLRTREMWGNTLKTKVMKI